MIRTRLGWTRFFWTLMIVFPPAAALEAAQQGPLAKLEGQICQAQYQDQCKALRHEIAALWQRIEQRPLQHELRNLRLDLNRALETFSALTADDAAAKLPAIRSKYQALQDILNQTERSSESGVPDIAYHHLELEAVQKVYQRFGSFELKPHEIGSKDNPNWIKLEAKTPWAGYWYPRYDPILFTGPDAAFAKLDRMMARIGRQSQAQSEEAALMSGPSDSWEGLCNAWANASIMEPEPKSAVHVLGETLSVADQKALITKLYEGYPVEIFGTRYMGDEITDGSYQDIRPDALHKLASHLLWTKRAFIIDDSAGIEVWQQPVFRMEFAMYPDESQPQAYHVDMRLWKIKLRSAASDELTSRKDYSFVQYQYRLFVDPELKAREGRLLVIAGEWLGDSRRLHPDYVVLPQENGRPQTFNHSIQSNADPILAILRHPASFP